MSHVNEHGEKCIFCGTISDFLRTCNGVCLGCGDKLQGIGLIVMTTERYITLCNAAKDGGSLPEEKPVICPICSRDVGAHKSALCKVCGERVCIRCMQPELKGCVNCAAPKETPEDATDPSDENTDEAADASDEVEGEAPAEEATEEATEEAPAEEAPEEVECADCAEAPPEAVEAAAEEAPADEALEEAAEEAPAEEAPEEAEPEAVEEKTDDATSTSADLSSK